MSIILDGTTGITTPAVDTTTAITASDGGTGQTSLTAGSVLVGNGTSAVTLVAAGSSGNVLTSNGTTWTSAAAGSGQLKVELFTAPGTWTKPATCTQVKVVVVGGGAGWNNSNGAKGGLGGVAVASNVPVSGPVTITVGSGGGVASAGGTSSFGSAVSATGGALGPANNVYGSPGTGTVSSGTAIKTVAATLSSTTAPYNIFVEYGGLISGIASAYSNGGEPYSATTPYIAGLGASTSPGVAVGGAVAVEYVG